MNTVISKIKEKILVLSKNEDENILKEKITQREINMLTNLYDTFSKRNEGYDDEELEELKEYKIPDVVLDFYRNIPLNYGIDIGGDINLMTIDQIIEENSECAPSAFFIKYGYLTIARTTGGNAICLNINELVDNEPSVIIADHSIFCDKEITIFKNEVLLTLELSYEVIKENAVEINSSFSGFLQMLLDNKIEDVEDYI